MNHYKLFHAYNRLHSSIQQAQQRKSPVRNGRFVWKTCEKESSKNDQNISFLELSLSQRTWKCKICDLKGVGPQRGARHYAECSRRTADENISVIDGFIDAVNKNRDHLRQIDEAFDQWMETRKKP